ncbi:MAG TPA: hypothetical protein VEY87_02995 [Gaiellaceae bacterium]|jgi:hypothetical protein|nr:hypothetical protein [Gaiellaceae bacterium]
MTPRITFFAAAATIVLALVAGAARTAVAPAALPPENAVVHWNAVATSAIAAGRTPASSSVLGGMVQGAIYDAVAAVEEGLAPFATDVTAAPGASVEAAVAQAARDVLVARVPAQAASVQSAYDSYLAEVPEGPAREAGTAAGAAAAAGMLAARSGDGFDDAVPYVQPTPGPGVFEPIAPTTPVDVKLPHVRPFTHASPADYRPDAPYALTSKRYAADVAEVQAYGRVASSVRTAEQTAGVRFFQDSPFVQFNRALRGLAVARGLDVRESARLFGYFNVAAADTMLACWEAKYHYLFWRPNHAIARADSDGNPRTEPEPGWAPLVVGNHPEYPSGHACFTAALTESLHRYFGTKHVELTLLSTTTGASRTYGKLDELTADVEDVRVWGGLHFRTTMTETAKHFPRIAKDVGKRYFLRGD